MPDGTELRSYVDDAVLTVHQQHAAAACQALEEALATANQRIKAPKCRLWLQQEHPCDEHPCVVHNRGGLPRHQRSSCIPGLMRHYRRSRTLGYCRWLFECTYQGSYLHTSDC
eukprot:6459527-Amphidinium_carterae.4